VTSGTITADLLDPGFYLDAPHDAYRMMRALPGLYRDETNDLWAVARHADVHDVESRPVEFISGQGYRSYFAPGETNMIAQDDPEHVDQRRLVARRFTPKAVREHETWLRATVRRLITEMTADGASSAEVVDALGAQLPCRFTAKLLGWPEERWADLKSWSERLMQYDRANVDPAAGTGIMEAIMEFAADLGPMVAERAGCPVHQIDDLMGVWANAGRDAGIEYDPQRLINETGLFISGGAETTRTVITRGLRVLCDHPDQWELLHDDPSLIPSAVDELIRWVTPLHNFFRTASVDTHVGEQAVAAGDRFILLYASANRDDAVFADPFTFDVRRSPNPHLAFGFGTHFCLGASLARFELGVLLEEMVARLTNLRVVDEVVDEPQVFAWAARSFVMGFDVRSAA
jgi:cytochrome P450 family 142 subfamily A polypeptide 1